MTGGPTPQDAQGTGDVLLDDLTVGYPGSGFRRTPVPVLAGLNLRAVAGRVTVLLGPNGSGKSTLLRTVAGLQRPLAGRVLLGGRSITDLDPRRRAVTVAVVLTERFDPGLLRGQDVVALGRYPHRSPGAAGTAADLAVVAAALAAVHAQDLADQPLRRMSDGQRQRVMIARALAQEPELLLLDEPSAYLDAPAKIELLALLRRIASERGIAVLTSTHDVETAVRLGQDGWLIGPDAAVLSATVGELAGSGAIGRAFDTPAVRFEPATGQFTLL